MKWLKRKKLKMDFDQNSIVAEKFRMVQTNLQFLKVDNRAIQTIVVTSSKKGEGKTFVAKNLGISFALQGKKTLVVDIDMHQPRLTSLYNMQLYEHLGISKLLAGEGCLDDGLISAPEDNLTVLLAGSTPPNPTELLGSDRMKELINEMKEKFDIIIFDSPPVNILNDVRAFSSICDGIIYIANYYETREKDVLAGIDALKKADANILGAIINGEKYSKKKRISYSYY